MCEDQILNRLDERFDLLLFGRTNRWLKGLYCWRSKDRAPTLARRSLVWLLQTPPRLPTKLPEHSETSSQQLTTMIWMMMMMVVEIAVVVVDDDDDDDVVVAGICR